MSCKLKTLSGALVALTLTWLVPRANAEPYGPRGAQIPIDLSGTNVLTARAGVPNPGGGRVDDACLAAARSSNGGEDGTIVVCSHGGDGNSQRVAPSKSVDESTSTGALSPPDLWNLPGCIGPCITVPFGRVPPPVYYIDLSTIPEAPKGSDAWKIGKGELRQP